MARDGWLEATNLAELEFLQHSFGTRHSLGLAADHEYASLRQVHSARWEEAHVSRGFLGEGDALITNEPGILVGVRTADCLPIILADPEHHAVAAVHAGWRGTARQIASTVVQAMVERYDSQPQKLVAAIGPGIGGECYEVGREVIVQLLPWLPPGTPVAKQRVGLANVNYRQLLESGLTDQNVLVGAPCTVCNPRDFHSYRRDGGIAGRMVSCVAIRSSQKDQGRERFTRAL